MKPTLQSTKFFPSEGKDHMQECISTAFEWGRKHGVSKVVIFTATGEGPIFAVQSLLPRAEYAHFRVVGVSPPVGKTYRADPTNADSHFVSAGVSLEAKEFLRGFDVPVVSAHLPFKEIYSGSDRPSELGRVGQALEVMGGGFALCIQAVLLACDAGVVERGERVIALTSDTAILARGTRTDRFFAPNDGLIVEHIICRATDLNISKPDHLAFKREPIEVSEAVAEESPRQLTSGEKK